MFWLIYMFSIQWALYNQKILWSHYIHVSFWPLNGINYHLDHACYSPQLIRKISGFKKDQKEFPGGSWLGLCALTAKGPGLIPG